jgi:nucleoid-associated protein YgaU
MSRDAKVGLVIVFAFVFLLGTILVHRFNLADLAKLTGGDTTAAVEPDAIVSQEDPTSDENPLESAASRAVTTVDALPDQEMNPALTGRQSGTPFNSGFSGTQRFTEQTQGSRPTDDESKSSDSGAHISVSSASDQQSGTSVVGQGSSPGSPRAHGNSAGQMSETEIPDTRTALPRRQPLLEISPRAPGGGTTKQELPSTDDDLPSTTGEVVAIDTKEPSTEMLAERVEPREGDTDPIAETQSGRPVPPLDRPPTLGPDENVAEMNAGSDSIQQAAEKRRPEPEDPSPPKLPKYGDPPRAIIESVPDREQRVPPRAGDAAAEDTEPISPSTRTRPANSNSGRSEDYQASGQKTYVVREGDSFWSISARQYGTGKYFRALEEYNKSRLSTSGNAGKVLRPGTVIDLPGESQLQSSSARKKSAEPAAPRSTKPDPWKEDDSAEPLSRRETASVPNRDPVSAPGTYRVKDGDTLSTIALRELGTSKRWQEIFQLNRRELDDPQGLKPGMLLKLPPATTAEKATARPNF